MKQEHLKMIQNIQNISKLLGEYCDNLITTIEKYHSTYIQYDSDSDAYFKAFSLKKISWGNENAIYL